MQDIYDVLVTRRSIRKFKADPVPEDQIQRIIETGLYAPTGMDRQQTIILKITDPETIHTLGMVNGRLMGKGEVDGFYGAPVVLAVLSRKDNPNSIFDGCSVISNMLNETASLGLGGCWIHRGKEQFETKEGIAILKKAGINPDEYEGVDNVVLGYIDGEYPKPNPRKDGRVFSID
ncbi:MAG: nitroreductase [Bilifractor sp.]|jgi:nitroreductase